jgi:hypothetical protein
MMVEFIVNVLRFCSVGIEMICEMTDKGFLITKLNSVALVRKRTIPTERPQPTGEVSANFS